MIEEKKDGLSPACKSCDVERRRKYYRLKAEQDLLTRQSTLVARELREKGLARCPICKEIKPLDGSFYLNKASKTGYSSHCIICATELQKNRPREERHTQYERDKEKLRDRTLQQKFGITLEIYNQLLAQQNGVCAICGGVDKKKSLAVDHDHSTGKIRGLLCGRCNPLIGFCLESPEIVRNVIEYLEKYQ